MAEHTGVFSSIFEGALKALKDEQRYRVFRELSRQRGDFPNALLHSGNSRVDAAAANRSEASFDTRAVAVWCSNDYLGMGQHPDVLKAMHDALDTYGTGAGGTRNISGTHHPIVQLERELASLHRKEAALVFSSGYVANDTALTTLGNILPECMFFSDSHNHASMIEGMRHSKAKRLVFRHNDPEHLRELLQGTPSHHSKVVAFESLYSMDGDFGLCEELITLAKSYGALVYVDETHAVGVYGQEGGGILEERRLLEQVDIVQGGLGKGYGVVGGFVTGTREAIDVIRSYGSGFIFTTALPPVVAAGALASVKHLRHSNIERETLFANVRSVRSQLTEIDLPIRPSSSQILPLMVCDAAKAQLLSEILLHEYAVYVQPINYPTVPRGSERLRITPAPTASSEQIRHLVNSLAAMWQRLQLKQAA